MLKLLDLRILMAIIVIGIPVGGFSQNLQVAKVKTGPIVDGARADTQWAEAKTIITRDKIANIDVSLSAVRTDRQIFFLVDFPDPDQSLMHKAWVWDSKEQVYKMGPAREDVFVFKWNLEPHPVDLSIFADNAYRADIWFWKACRTDPVGFADDKYQCLRSDVFKGSKQIISRSGRPWYIGRFGDQGDPAYKTKIYVAYQGDMAPRFENVMPTGSRADICAKGRWANGRWTIEFSRLLNTGHEDDIQFKPGGTYQFGISRYEIAGREPDLHSSQPLFGTGDISEVLSLDIGR